MILDLLEDFWGEKILQACLILCQPEPEDFLDKVDNEVATLHMALFSQEMDEYILSVMDFIDLGGNIAEQALRSDLVKVYRQEFCQLFDQVVDRLNIAI